MALALRLFINSSQNMGGLEASELKRVKELEQKLSDYKTMVAELTPDNRALKNLPSANL